MAHIQFWGGVGCFSGNRTYERCCFVNGGAVSVYPNMDCWHTDSRGDRCCASSAHVRGQYNLPWVRSNPWLAGCNHVSWDQVFLATRMEQNFLRDSWDHARSRLNPKRWLFDDMLLLRSLDERSCPLGNLVIELAEYMTQIDGSYAYAALAPKLHASIVIRLKSADMHLNSRQLFAVIGHTVTQILYVLFGTPSIVQIAAQPFLPPLAIFQRAKREKHLVIELGMGGGLNALFFLLHGIKVVGVDAHSEMLNRSVRPLLKSYELKGLLQLRNAVVLPRSSRTRGHAQFFLHEVLPEESSAMGPVQDGGHVIKVPSTSCWDLLSRWRGEVLYLKCDIEGMDFACASDLDASVAPPFASFELPKPLTEASKMDEAIKMLQHLANIGYKGFKICRQRPYISRCWGTRCHGANKGNPQLDLIDSWHAKFKPWTLGLSDPFGRAAVDWSRGEEWASLDEILMDLPGLAEVNRRYNEHFDAHVAMELY